MNRILFGNASGLCVSFDKSPFTVFCMVHKAYIVMNRFVTDTTK